MTGPVEAVKTALVDAYWQPEGRARRSEYWWFTAFTLVAYALLVVIGAWIGPPLIAGLVAVAVSIPHVTCTIRRLHDIGRSGAWYFILFVPFIGGLLLLPMLLKDSGPDNEYGPSEKYGVPAPTPQWLSLAAPSEVPTSTDERRTEASAG